MRILRNYKVLYFLTASLLVSYCCAANVFTPLRGVTTAKPLFYPKGWCLNSNGNLFSVAGTPTNSLIVISTEAQHNGEIYKPLLPADFSTTVERTATSEPRSRTSFNKGWKFYLGDQPQAKAAQYNDLKWRKLTLPHDWSIEGKFDEKNPAKPEGGGLPTGIGWYRKEFIAPANFKNRLITIEFDGVYKNSEVWVNGRYLGKRPYGYSSFSYEIGQILQSGKNIIAVKVDNSAQPDSRWYSGSGIYRNVWLSSTAKIAVAKWGTFVTADQTGKVMVKTQIQNQTQQQQSVVLVQAIYDSNGKLILKTKAQSFKIDTSGTIINSDSQVKAPELWSPVKPVQYKLVTQLFQNNTLTDSYETKFGFRTFNFDAAKGFSLNGTTTKILGVCLHHDLGALGAAVNVRAMERQLEIMKAMGVNAIRTAHNPPAPEFLDLCDQMGFLVMDEAFDMWAKKKTKNDYHLNFPEWHKRDLEDMIKRVR